MPLPKIPEFIFNSDKHVYTLDGVALPSVTSILKAEGLMGDMQFATDWHMDRGTHVHKTIELYLSGTLDEETLDPQLMPYLASFKAFMAATGFEVYGYETPMFHPTYRYAGTPDLWGLLDGKMTLLDFKTGVPAAWHNAQCGAYSFLLNSDVIVKQAGCLYLAEDGRYTMSRLMSGVEIRQNIDIFLSALKIYNWKKENIC